jgi:predicted aspartyl protease
MTTTLPLEILNIEEDGLHLITTIYINEIPAKVIIDTGATRSVFDQEKVKRFSPENPSVLLEKFSTGLGTDNMPTSIIDLASIRIGDLKISSFNAVVLDLSHVNLSYHKLGIGPIDGVIGNDILFTYKAVIDYSDMTLTLKT